jgi:hypothetical protein
MRRWLLRVYPARWRERYGDEIRELLDQTGIGPREVVDVMRGGIAERAVAARRLMAQGGMQMVIGPAWRHPTAWAAVAALLIAPSVLVLSWGLLFNIAVPNDALETYRALDLLLVMAPLPAVLLAMAPLVRLELRHGQAGTEAVVGLRLRAVNLLVGAVALLLGVFLAGHIVVESVLRIGA